MQIAVGAQGDLTRKGQVAAPAVILHRNRLNERAHPAVYDLALAIVEGLRSVIVVAAIPQTELGFRLERLARGPRADHVAGVGNVAVHETGGLCAHGGEADDPLLIALGVLDREEVRAFKHEDVRIRVFEQHTLVGPTNHVIGGEQPHLAALFYGGDTEGHVPLVSGLPYLRVTVVVVDLIERAIDDHAALGGAGQLVVVWFGDHLHLPVAAGVVDAVGPAVAGVVELELAVIADHCGTGEHAVLFLFESRGEHDRLTLPVEHVVGGDVTPVHRAPLGAVRVQLVEHVPTALVEAQAVRIVDPAAVGGDVELRIPTVVARGGHGCNARLRLCQSLAVVLDFVKDGCVRGEASHR